MSHTIRAKVSFDIEVSFDEKQSWRSSPVSVKGLNKIQDRLNELTNCEVYNLSITLDNPKQISEPVVPSTDPAEGNF